MGIRTCEERPYAMGDSATYFVEDVPWCDIITHQSQPSINRKYLTMRIVLNKEFFPSAVMVTKEEDICIPNVITHFVARHHQQCPVRTLRWFPTRVGNSRCWRDPKQWRTLLEGGFTLQRDLHREVAVLDYTCCVVWVLCLGWASTWFIFGLSIDLIYFCIF